MAVVGKTRAKSILRVWSAQVSAQVCLVAFVKYWNVRYRHDYRAGLDIGPVCCKRVLGCHSHPSYVSKVLGFGVVSFKEGSCK